MTAKNRQGKKPPLDKKRHRNDALLKEYLTATCVGLASKYGISERSMYARIKRAKDVCDDEVLLKKLKNVKK